MSGYIENLLQRAMRGSEVRPRAMLPFEPVNEAQVEDRQSCLSPSPLPAPAKETGQAGLPVLHSQTNHVVHEREHVLHDHDRVVERHVDRTVVVREMEGAPLVVHTAPADGPVMQSREDGEASQPRRPSHSEILRSAQDDERPRVSPAPAEVPESRAFAESPAPATQRVMTHEIRESHRTETRILTPVAQSVIASPGEPTIQITIGRVDVRAVNPPQTTTPPPPPAPPKAPPRPQLTLEEYLRSRGTR